ncbi:unnamed protein product [marine sediment metagenome]|uniref:Uncharacterized protein n=1 Tax=marine sediment metagenome TaxID=412755 RepID=X0W1I9_9ZZZZ
MKSNRANCRECGKMVLWMKTQRNKNIMVDYKKEFENHGHFDKDLGHECHWDTCQGKGDKIK